MNKKFDLDELLEGHSKRVESHKRYEENTPERERKAFEAFVHGLEDVVRPLFDEVAVKLQAKGHEASVAEKIDPATRTATMTLAIRRDEQVAGNEPRSKEPSTLVLSIKNEGTVREDTYIVYSYPGVAPDRGYAEGSGNKLSDGYVAMILEHFLKKVFPA
jgi:hypothetical protein